MLLRAVEIWFVLLTLAIVYWNCHVAETLRRKHADLVTDRP